MFSQYYSYICPWDQTLSFFTRQRLSYRIVSDKCLCVNKSGLISLTLNIFIISLTFPINESETNRLQFLFVFNKHGTF